jgi:UDP-4-amino-4,6-dideoxy-N-acetyl-beta-L-altrosamine transaminase
MKYPYAKHNINDDDINAVVDVLKNKSITQGTKVDEFESELAKYLDAKYVIACSSGTAALHLIYLAMGLNENTAIITTPITFLATANAARLTGAKVYFADVDKDTGLILEDSVRKILKNKKNKIKALVLVHLGSKTCNLEKYAKIAKDYDIHLIEDSCHAFGEKYISSVNEVSMVGSAKHSYASSLSFHAIKNITTGEGGAVITNNKKFANKIKLLRSHGNIRDSDWNDITERGPWYYESKLIGYNYRITDFQAALGISQLKRLSSQNKYKYGLAKIYNNLLKDIKYIKLPVIKEEKYDQAWHLYSIALNFKDIGKSRNEVMKKLLEKGIGTQVHYIPLYKQPIYKSNSNKKYPGAEAYFGSTLSLPMYSSLLEKDIEYIVKSLKEVLFN